MFSGSAEQKVRKYLNGVEGEESDSPTQQPHSWIIEPWRQFQGD